MTLIRIQNRRGNASAWSSADPTLEPGELGIESDTGKFKIGDGSTAWTTLPYAATRPTDLTNTVDDYVLLADVGTAGNPPSLNVDKNLIVPGASIVVEGSTDNAYETTLTVTNPTADRTITFKNADGTVAFVSDLDSYILTSAIGGATGVAGLDSSSDLIVPGDAIIFEGSTANEYETTLQVTDPTADRSVTIPNASGTVITTGNLTDITSVGTLSSLTVTGDLTVNGTTTTLNSTTLSVDDKNIEIGSVDTPTDITANGGGIVLKGATDKTILWSSDSGAWTSSEDIALSAGKTLIFEGATDNTYETKLTVVDPTGDRTITFPNETGTVAIESWVSSALGAYVTTATVGSTVASLVDGRLPSNQLTTNVAFMSDVSTAKTAAEQTAAADATSKVSAHENDTTSIHGIADTSALATKSGTETFTNKTLTSPKINEDVAVTATATELNLIDGSVAGTVVNSKAVVYGSAGEINATTLQIAGTSLTATATELNYVDGVTSAIQTQIDAKAASADIAELAQDAIGNSVGTGLSYNDTTGAISVTANTYDAYGSASTVAGNLSTHESDTTTHGTTGNIVGTSDTQTLTNKTLTSPKINEDVAVTATATELNYVDGVTSAIQTQIDNKASLSGATFTGAVSGTSLTLSGDLTVNGTTTNLNSTNLVVEDKNIVLGDTETPTDITADGGGITLKGSTDKTFNWVDATDSWTSSEHINLASGKSLYLNGTLLKDATETFTNKTLTSPNINEAVALSATSTELNILDGATLSTTELNYVDGVTSAIQTQIDAKISASSTDTLTNKTLTSPKINEDVAVTATATELNYVDGVTSAIQTQLNAKTPELYTFTTDATTSRTLALVDNFASLRFTSASATTVTVPANSAVAFPIGSYVELYAFGSGQITVTQSAGVTVNATDSQKKSRVQYSSMTLIKIATDEWLLVGDTAA